MGREAVGRARKPRGSDPKPPWSAQPSPRRTVRFHKGQKRSNFFQKDAESLLTNGRISGIFITRFSTRHR